MSNRAPRLKTTRSGGVAIVDLLDKKILDEAAIAQIASELLALAGQADTPRLVVDFANVTHMSSGALGMLITLLKRMREKDGQLRLCNINPSIYEVFAITRLNEVFNICKTREDAVGELASP